MASNFDLTALHEALDSKRRSLGLTWAEATREINRHKTNGHPVATSTITGLRSKAAAEGDGVLQMLLWLDRTPESFVAGFPDANAERYRLRRPPDDLTLRWDVAALHSAMNEQRQARGLAWSDIGREIGGFTAVMLTRMANGGRIGFPGVMRIVGWLNLPATNFTHAVPSSRGPISRPR